MEVDPALFLELGGIIVALAAAARVAGWLGFSPIPLYLLGGLAIGEGGIFPLLAAEEFIRIGGEIGVILLLLMLGLDYSAEELTEGLATGAPAGLVDLLLNFTPGFVLGLLLGWDALSSAFLGGVTYISSSGVVAKLIRDLEWIANREVPTVLSLLVIEDLVMAAYLPLMAALLVGGGIASATLSILLALTSVVVVIFIAVRFGTRISEVVFSRSDEALLLSILGITLVVAGIAERLHISAAVGAFLVGIALSGSAADRARSLLSPLRDLFAAVFFVFFGLSIDPGAIPPVLLTAVVLALVTAVTKVLTGWWAARRAGVGPRGRLRAGAALVARGEFSIIIAGLGLATGIEPTLGPLAAAYVLLVAVGGPVLARTVVPLADLWQGARAET